MTEKQLAASRANGAKSHGPVTEEGKQRSAMNALKLGLHSELAVVDGESMGMFNTLRQSYLDRFQPFDPVELDMVEQMVAATEAEVLNDAMDESQKWLVTKGYEPGSKIPPHAHIGIATIKKERSLANLGRQEARLTRIYNHAFQTLLKLKQLNKCTDNEPSKIANKELPVPQPAQQTPGEPFCPPPTAHRPLPAPVLPASLAPSPQPLIRKLLSTRHNPQATSLLYSYKMRFCKLLFVILLGGTLLAAEKKSTVPARPTAKPFTIPIKDVKLKNGLRVILSEDHSAPTYSIAVTYNVGSRDERPGRTGFAHLFEHMMYQGSENVGKGEHFILVQNYGGSMNGSTNSDRTYYYQTLPANQMDLGLFLESDRMRSLVINQANLDNQRNAVQEERRLRVDNQPYGKTYEAMAELGYTNFAYKHSTIGSMEDLNSATVQDVADFFKMYYAPNNAVLTLVGDFASETALAKVGKYFDGIPAHTAPPSPDMAEAPQTAERRTTIEDAFAMTPRLDIAYKIPPANTPDWYALQVMSRILGGGGSSGGSSRRGGGSRSSGDSSRLYQKLIRETEAAMMVYCSAAERRGPSQESFVVMARPGRDLSEIEKLLGQEIERMKNEYVTDAELAKVRLQLHRQHIQSLEGTLSRAMELGKLAVYYNDPGLINTQPEKLQQVTKEDIRRVARTYLKDTNRTVIITLPKGKIS